MTWRRDQMAALCLTLAWGASCAVFPDEAVLPGASSLAGAGAGGEAAPVGAAGSPGLGDGGLDSGGRGGAMAAAGTAGNSVEPTAGSEAGGAPSAAGAAGSGGQTESGCESPVDAAAPITVDTWIEQANGNSGHGTDDVLSVVGGGAERRALLELALPDFPLGSVLLEARLELYLETNADLGRSKRRLALQRLLHAFDEGKATWRQFDNGIDGDWMNEGGDFAPQAGEQIVPAGTQSGTISIDAAPALSPAFASGARVSLIVREVGAPPLAPADLSFTARDGAASQAPTLHFRYCPP